MADLLPSLSSDDDEAKLDQDDDLASENLSGKDDDNDDDEAEEINTEFEFGGILGEDGVIQWTQNGWSYQTALKAIENGSNGQTPGPLDVASLITAKRNMLKNLNNNNNNNNNVNKQPTQQQLPGIKSRQDEIDADDAKASKNIQDEGYDPADEDQIGDDDDDDDSDEEDDKVDDANYEMEDDVLKMRTHNKQLTEPSEKADDDDDDDDEDIEPKTTSEDKKEAQKAANFFEDISNNRDGQDVELFAQLTLSRPLLLGVAAMGFVKPTPIQARVIPVALMGRDVCASAVTGSGKTAAFLLPICERLLHRPTTGRIKAIILMPTRELAAQCLGMLASLTQHCPNLRAALVVGGSKNVAVQAAELRTRPSIVVATPGRLLDHVTNSAGVTFDDVEFLVLDEADRLLDLGFQQEVHELVKACPTERQTMLFSATLNTKVDDLIQLSLKRPVRIHISDKGGAGNNGSNTKIEVAPRLEQEFVRVRAGNEGNNREAMLLALLTRTFMRRTIVFFDTKVVAHRLMILCGLCGIQCAELHGNLTQAQRLVALEQFRQGEVDILLATDLAARGLDIDLVGTVINFEMPSQVETYVHRIGRTARAGRGGKSCTLIGEGRRHLMKEVIKDADEKKINGRTKSVAGVIRSRTIPQAVIAHFVSKIHSLEEHVKEVMQAEAVAKMDRLAEMEATRAQHMIEHADEIQARPKREWFASNKQKESTKQAAAEKQKMIEEKVGTGTHRMTRKKRRAREAREAMAAPPDDDGEEAKNGTKSKKTVTDLTIKVSARAHKKKEASKVSSEYGRSVHDEDEHRMQQCSSKGKRKGAFASDAAGDSSIFDDEKVAYSKKKTKNNEDERVKSSYKFEGYDPLKQGKKSKKKSVHAFKSKSKYKRKK